MPECEGCKKDVKRISKYEMTGQWLCDICAAKEAGANNVNALCGLSR